MKHSFVFAVLAALMLTGFCSCVTETAMERNYSGSSSQAKPVEPVLKYSDNLEFDRMDLESSGYRLVGSSSFTGKEYSYERLTSQVRSLAIQHGASYAVYGGVYRETVTHTTYESYRVLVSPQYKDKPAVYATEWRPVENTERYFDYYAYLYVPMTQQEILETKIGIDFDDLDSQKRIQLRRNTGAYVRMVYKNSPAFYSNIIPGDVVTAINDVKILDSSGAKETLAKITSGQTVRLTYWRDGSEKTITLTAE